MEEKEIDLIEDASAYRNVLRLNVENLGELKDLLENVKEKEKALQDAVRELERFQLKILFSKE